MTRSLTQLFLLAFVVLAFYVGGCRDVSSPHTQVEIAEDSWMRLLPKDEVTPLSYTGEFPAYSVRVKDLSEAGIISSHNQFVPSMVVSGITFDLVVNGDEYSNYVYVMHEGSAAVVIILADNNTAIIYFCDKTVVPLTTPNKQFTDGLRDSSKSNDSSSQDVN